jgi:hypothetical protein
MANAAELPIRMIDMENLVRFQRLYKRCFDIDTDQRYFEWKYQRSPAGKIISCEAYDGDNIAAFYAVLPWPMQLDGRKLLFYQSLDTMTDPDYQRRGLFVKTANFVYDYLEQTFPGNVIIGIPGISSYPGFVNKLNWKNPFGFKYRVANRYIFYLAKTFRARSEQFEYRTIVNPIEELAEYHAKRIAPKGRLEVDYTPTFLQWRVTDHPLIKYTILGLFRSNQCVGYVVYKTLTQEKGGQVMIDRLDFVSPERYNAASVTAVTSEIFKRTGAQFVITWHQLVPDRERALAESGYLKNPFDKGPFSFTKQFIVRSSSYDQFGINLLDHGCYELQPLMQD